MDQNIITLFRNSKMTKHSNDSKYLSGTASLWNFISLHMKSLGFGPSEIGIIMGIPPFFGGLSTVLAGLSDFG